MSAIEFIIKNSDAVINVCNQGLSQKGAHDALKHLEGCPSFNTLKTYLKPSAELITAYEKRINAVKLETDRKNAEINRLRKELIGMREMYEGLRNWEKEYNQAQKENQKLTKERDQARKANGDFHKAKDEIVRKLEARIMELDQENKNLRDQTEKTVIHPVIHDSPPKNVMGWTLNKRKTGKDGKPLYNLAKKIDGKLKVKYLGAWDQNKAQKLIQELNREFGLDGGDEREAFKAALDAVGNGRSFVRIHRIREHLGWPRERFDSVLKDLRGDYTIQLTGGDPSKMTKQEKEDSFVDEKGRLRISVTWRK